MLCKPLVSGFPAVLSSPGCSKQNRHTCLPKQYWFPAAAVRWNNLARTITIFCPHFTPCICLHRYARAIAALNVRRHYLISSILSSKIHPLTPLLTSCSFHGLSSVAGDSLAEIIYQTGEGCFIIIPSTSASSMKRSRTVHSNYIFLLCVRTGVFKEMHHPTTPLWKVICSSPHHLMKKFPLKLGNDNPKSLVISHFLCYCMHTTLEAFAK